MSTITTSQLFIALIFLSIITIALVIIVLWMYSKLRRFLVGIDSENISDSLTVVSRELKDLQSFRKELETYLAGVEKRLRKSVQSVNTVRFNPFKGTGEGGNQSFATAFLNEEGDGVVISSLHAREHIRVFSKPVVNRNSEYELSEEEKEAVTMSQNNKADSKERTD
jgi:hypothetical protein